MKAAGIPHKCTPRRGAGHPGNGKVPAHVPVRRAVGAPLQRVPDTVPDSVPDSVPDTVPDSVPDTVPDSVPDTAPDTAPDTVPDTVPDSVPDTAPRGVPDTAPHVLHIDNDSVAGKELALLLIPEARVTHVLTLAAAREALQRRIFSAVVLDPDLPDGDASALLPALANTPLLVYSVSHPGWSVPSLAYLPKPWASPRQLWTTISGLLGLPTPTAAGD